MPSLRDKLLKPDTDSAAPTTVRTVHITFEKPWGEPRKRSFAGIALSGLLSLIVLAVFGTYVYDTYTHEPPPHGGAVTVALKPRTFEDHFLLIRLLREGKYAELDARLSDLRALVVAGELDDIVLDHAYRAFASANPALERPLTEWIEANPRSAAPWLARGRYYLHLAWAARDTAWADRIPPDGMERLRTNLFRGINDIREAITRDGRLTPAYALAYEAARYNTSLAEGAMWLERGFKASPCSLVMHQAKMWLLQPGWGGSIEAIEAHLKTAAARCPNLAGLRGFADYARAVVAMDDGEYERALRYFDRALSYGEWPAYRYRRGRSLARLKRYPGAIEEFEAALRLQPQAPHILNDIAKAQVEQGETERALEAWNQALALDPWSPKILAARAEYLEQLGQTNLDYFDRAREDLSRARRYVGNRQVLHRLASRLENAIWTTPGSIALFRRDYYANPLNEYAATQYLSQLRHAFRCDQVPEFRAFLAHCAKMGRCNPSATRLHTLDLERSIKENGCNEQVGSNGPPNTPTAPAK